MLFEREDLKTPHYIDRHIHTPRADLLTDNNCVMSGTATHTVTVQTLLKCYRHAWKDRIRNQTIMSNKKNASLPPPGDSETFSQQYEHQKEHQETDGEQ